MKKLNLLWPIGAVLSILFVNGAHAIDMNPQIPGFPYACREATMNMPLQGHMLRAGIVYWNGSGWSFSFPDHYSSRGLQTSDLAQNAGISGLNYDDDQPDPPISATPPGSFVIGQILVGDENSEPITTCISPPLPVAQFNPVRYLGSEWSWLQGGVFAERLKWKRFHKWNWRRWWGNDYFRSYRRDYGSFRNVLKHRRYNKIYRDDRRRDRRRDNRLRYDRRDRRDDRAIRPIRMDDDNVNRQIRRDRDDDRPNRQIRRDNDGPGDRLIRHVADPVDNKPNVRAWTRRDRDDDNTPKVKKQQRSQQQKRQNQDDDDDKPSRQRKGRSGR